MRKHHEVTKMERLSATTRTERTYSHVAKVKDAETGEVSSAFVRTTEKVTVNDLSTPSVKDDTRVFWRGARIA